MASVKPAAGEVVEQTTQTRIRREDPPPPPAVARPRDIWDYVESVPVGDWASGERQFTIYRGRKSQRAEEKTWIGKFQEKITQDIIKERWGGGEYNVWLKIPPGSQLAYNEDLKIDGLPKTHSEALTSNGSAASSSEIGQVLAMMREDRQMFMAAIERLSGSGSSQKAVEQALALNGQVFSSAMPAVVDTLARVGSANGGSNGGGGMDEITRRFLEAAISKMMNPADPIETFAKMTQAMGSIGFKMGGGNPSGGIAVELGRALIGTLPQLASHVGGIMDQYRRAEEAKLQHAALVRGQHVPAAPAAPQPAAPPTKVLEMPAPAGDAATPAQGGLTGDQAQQAEALLQFVETKVVELLLDPNLTPEEAANDALTFMDVTDKTLVDALLQHGDMGVRWAFENRAILKQVPKGPRLDAFIAEFVNKGKKVAMPIPPMPDPNIPPA